MVEVEVGNRLASGLVLKVQLTGFADSIDGESRMEKREREESRMNEEFLVGAAKCVEEPFMKMILPWRKVLNVHVDLSLLRSA